MGNDVFDGQILAEKLLKLNNSQQSIESLSRLCITHRKRAKEIVETWDKLFNASQKEQRISFLYLANDILQNSRRKGSEFVNEFWKVLPAALRLVYESDEHGKKAVTRLVDIWEERKVFGSRGQGLKDELMGNRPGSTLLNDLQEQEKELEQYMMQLENGEAARTTLLSQLKDALQDQESRQQLVHDQLLAARGQIEQATSIRKRLSQAPKATKVLEQNLPSVQRNSTPPQTSFIQPSISFAPFQTTEEDKKAAAAAVAAKLAASTSSAFMLTSVLSSLVAEEAASMNDSLNSTGFTSGLPVFIPEKRPKLEKSMPASDVNSSDTGSSFFATSQQPSVANVPLTTSLQPMSPPLQATFASGPPPLHSPMNPPANQYVQSTGLMVGGIPYGYVSNNVPPPPPLPPHVAIGLSRPGTLPSQAQQVQQQQQSPTGGFYRPPGIGFYGQSYPSTPPAPVPRQ